LLIFESILTPFEGALFFDAAGAVLKISLSLKPFIADFFATQIIGGAKELVVLL